MSKILAKTFFITKFDERKASLTPIKVPITAPIPRGIAAAKTINPDVPDGVPELALWNK
jgi:hypothetical protein